MMPRGLRKSYIIPGICAFFMIAFLVVVPVLVLEADAPAQDSEAADEIIPDPLGRLPNTPEEAHQRLEESQNLWPEDLGGDDFSAAAVQPGVRVSIPFDTVEGFTTSPGGTAVRVELIRGVVIQTVDTTTNPNRWFYADLSTGDIQSGDTVRVTDLGGGAAVNINCTLTANISAANDRVNGTAPSGNTVDAYIMAPSTYYGDIPPGVASQRVTAAGGNYTANFPNFNIRRGDVTYVYSTDAAGNSVQNAANTGGSLVVYPQYDEVMGYYLPNTPLTVFAGTAARNTTTAKDGFLDAWFSDYDIVPGDQVRCNMGGNRSITVADVSATCDPYTNIVQGTAPANTQMRLTMDVYGDPIVIETTSNGAGDFSVNLDGIYTASGNEVYNVCWYNAAEDAVVYEFHTYSWFLPEGYTGIGFDEWVLVMNPQNRSTQVRVVYQTLAGQAEGPLINTLGNSRSTVHVNAWVPDQMVSTMVTSIDGGQIMAERAMYMYETVDGKWGAHDSIGTMTPGSVWYLPEGATYFGFDEWVLIQNPNDVEITAKVQFLGRGGVEADFDVTVQARSRWSIHANEYVPNSEFSTKVECLTQVDGETLPVFAERAMYMNTLDGKVGAHDSIGICCPRPEWYLPEGTTRPGFDEWVLVMNPNNVGTNVRATFLTPEGVGNVFDFSMAPNSRFSIHVNDFIVDNDVSTVITSLDGAGIMAERAMYMNTPDGKIGAHDSIGSSQLQTYWFLPEGTTRPGFDEWVLIVNPNAAEVEVLVTLLGPTGPAAQLPITMAANSRFSVHVNDLVDNLDVSTVVESTGAGALGVLAERAMYMWTADNKQGAHDSIGIPNF